MDFGDQLRQFAEKTDGRTNLVVKKIVFDIGTALPLKTPVGDPSYWQSPPPPGYVGGRARGNWQYGINQPNRFNESPIDKTGASVTTHIGAAIPDRATGLVHYITNSVPYIEPLENGHSWRQAPNGMVNLTALEFDPIVRAAVAELS